MYSRDRNGTDVDNQSKALVTGEAGDIFSPDRNISRLVGSLAAPIFASLHPDDVERIQRSIQRSAEELSLWSERYRVIGADGRERWMEGHSKPERQADGSRHPFDSFIVSKTPAARWGNPEDLMGPAIFLASDASNFVNGHVLYVDGGILAYIGKQPK
mgnify:CR=1 FL=1